MIINEDSFRFLAFMAKFNNCFLHTSTFYIFLILLFYHHRYPHIILWKKLYIKVVVCKHLYSIVGKLYIMQKIKLHYSHFCWVIFIVKCFGNAISNMFLHWGGSATSLSVRETIFRCLKDRGAFSTLSDTHFFFFYRAWCNLVVIIGFRPVYNG